MASKSVTIRIPETLLGRLEAHVVDTGGSKTTVMIAALAKYLEVAQPLPLSERLAQMERRIANLEARCNGQ